MAPVRRALIWGVNAYPAGYELSGCVPDVNLLARTLTAERTITTAPLFDGDATRANILDLSAAYLRESKSGDVFILANSSHGTYVPDTDGDEGDRYDEAVCPVDSIDSGAFLTDDDLRALFSKAPAGVRIVVFSDSCYSGTMTRFGAANPPPLTVTARRRARYARPTAAMWAAHREYRLWLDGRRSDSRTRVARPVVRPEDLRSVHFSACLPTEVAYETWNADGTSNGDFTRALCAVLAATGPTVTRRGVLSRVMDRLGPEPWQTPTLDCAPGLDRKTLWGVTAA